MRKAVVLLFFLVVYFQCFAIILNNESELIKKYNAEQKMDLFYYKDKPFTGKVERKTANQIVDELEFKNGRKVGVHKRGYISGGNYYIKSIVVYNNNGQIAESSFYFSKDYLYGKNVENYLDKDFLQERSFYTDGKLVKETTYHPALDSDGNSLIESEFTETEESIIKKEYSVNGEVINFTTLKKIKNEDGTIDKVYDGEYIFTNSYWKDTDFGQYNNGVKTGYWKTISSKNYISYECFYDDKGAPEKALYYREKDLLSKKLLYSKGILQRKIEYYKDSSIASDITYNADETTRNQIQHFKDGTPERKVIYSDNGDMTGIYYFTNGNIFKKESWSAEKQSGRREIYYADGNIQRQEKYNKEGVTEFREYNIHKKLMKEKNTFSHYTEITEYYMNRENQLDRPLSITRYYPDKTVIEHFNSAGTKIAHREYKEGKLHGVVKIKDEVIGVTWDLFFEKGYLEGVNTISLGDNIVWQILFKDREKVEEMPYSPWAYKDLGADSLNPKYFHFLSREDKEKYNFMASDEGYIYIRAGKYKVFTDKLGFTNRIEMDNTIIARFDEMSGQLRGFNDLNPFKNKWEYTATDYYYANGQPKKIIKIERNKNGTLKTAEFKYYENGQLTMSFLLLKFFHDNGVVKEEKHNLLDYHYRPNGSLKEISHHERSVKYDELERILDRSEDFNPEILKEVGNYRKRFNDDYYGNGDNTENKILVVVILQIISMIIAAIPATNKDDKTSFSAVAVFISFLSFFIIKYM